MGQRGPNPLPPNVHLLRGNASKKPLASLLDDVLRPPVAIPEVPEFLRYGGAGPEVAIAARAEWNRITPHLERLGLVSHLDMAALAEYCFWFGVGAVAKRRVAELGDAALVDVTPSGYKQMGVWIQVAGRAAAEMKSLLSHFGMSPSARSRVTVSDPQGAGHQPELPGLEPKPQVGGWGGFE